MAASRPNRGWFVDLPEGHIHVRQRLHGPLSKFPRVTVYTLLSPSHAFRVAMRNLDGVVAHDNLFLVHGVFIGRKEGY